MEGSLQTVVETASFLRTAKQAGLSELDCAAIVDQVAAAPDAGDLVQGSGGVRKVRFGGSGGHRVMVGYLDADIPVYLLAVLSKRTRADFTAAEIDGMHAVMKAIKRARQAR